jgi:heat shock protein 5
LQDKVSAEDKKTVLDAVKEAMEWVEENAEADADEFNDRRKELEDVVNPIVSKLYAAGGGPGGAAGGDEDLGDHDEL